MIEAPANSDTNRSIRKATLNGKPLEKMRIPFSDITAGGRLVLEMGPDK